MRAIAKSGAAMLLAIGLVVSTRAAEPEKAKTIRVLIKPECKDQFYGPDFVDLDRNGRVIKKPPREKPDYLPWDPGRAHPLSYRDPRTSIFFYVESDGRHLAAIDPDGRLLWVRDPFEDRHMCPYRTPRPTIGRLEAVTESSEMRAVHKKNWGEDVSDKLLYIQFSSSQFGVVDETTGEFFPEGQN